MCAAVRRERLLANLRMGGTPERSAGAGVCNDLGLAQPLPNQKQNTPRRSNHKLSATVEVVPVGTYILPPGHSSVSFVTGHSGVTKFRGELEEVEAKLENTS